MLPLHQLQLGYVSYSLLPDRVNQIEYLEIEDIMFSFPDHAERQNASILRDLKKTSYYVTIAFTYIIKEIFKTFDNPRYKGQ